MWLLQYYRRSTCLLLCTVYCIAIALLYLLHDHYRYSIVQFRTLTCLQRHAGPDSTVYFVLLYSIVQQHIVHMYSRCSGTSRNSTIFTTCTYYTYCHDFKPSSDPESVPIQCGSTVTMTLVTTAGHCIVNLGDGT